MMRVPKAMPLNPLAFTAIRTLWNVSILSDVSSSAHQASTALDTLTLL
jgi:hypothetical protein